MKPYFEKMTFLGRELKDKEREQGKPNADEIAKVAGYNVDRSKSFLKEFAVQCPRSVDEINEYLLESYGIIGGYDLGIDYPELASTMLVCVTEMNTKEEIDTLAEALRSLEEEA